MEGQLETDITGGKELYERTGSRDSASKVGPGCNSSLGPVPVSKPGHSEEASEISIGGPERNLRPSV
jgi:hypothetical protein